MTPAKMLEHTRHECFDVPKSRKKSYKEMMEKGMTEEINVIAPKMMQLRKDPRANLAKQSASQTSCWGEGRVPLGVDVEFARFDILDKARHDESVTVGTK